MAPLVLDLVISPKNWRVCKRWWTMWNTGWAEIMFRSLLRRRSITVVESLVVTAGAAAAVGSVGGGGCDTAATANSNMPDLSVPSAPGSSDYIYLAQ